MKPGVRMAFWNEVVNAEVLQATNYLCLAETIRAFKGVECICYNGTMLQRYNVTMLHVTMKQSKHSKGLNALCYTCAVLY